jgi:phosphate uptake regulator
MSILKNKKISLKAKGTKKANSIAKKKKNASLSRTKLMKMKVDTMKIHSPFIRKQTLELRKKIIGLITSSIEIQKMAIQCLSDVDKKTALNVLKMDDRIDVQYNGLLKDSTFSLTQQPLAKELRRVIGYIQIAKNLE